MTREDRRLKGNLEEYRGKGSVAAGERRKGVRSTGRLSATVLYVARGAIMDPTHVAENRQ